jgi:hypothetical protein
MILIDICENSEIIKEFGRHTKMTVEDYDQVVEDVAYLKNKMQTMTFGQLIGIIHESKSLSYDETRELKELLEKRNYFVHEYFKYTSYVNADESFIVEEFTAIKEYLAKLKKVLSRLELIKDNQTNRLNYLKGKAGL